MKKTAENVEIACTRVCVQGDTQQHTGSTRNEPVDNNVSLAHVKDAARRHERQL
jgi:hypothetical protein